MNNIINIFKGGKKLKEETIKIEIEDENKNETSKGNVEFIDNVENLEYLNKKDVAQIQYLTTPFFVLFHWKNSFYFLFVLKYKIYDF